MQKPTLKEFQANTKAKSADVNYNFEELSDYVFGSSDELKTFIQTQVANMNLALNNTIFTGKIEIYSGSADSIPTGYLLCNGSEVSRETYSNLFDVIGTTYGEGNGVNTFNVPNLIAKFIEGGSTAGTVKEAGLPEHYHYIAGGGSAVSLTQDTSIVTYYSGGGDGWTAYNLKGSNAEATAGKTSITKGFNVTDTVQPPAVTMLYIIKT